MNAAAIEMETRQCANPRCTTTFRVMTSSPQRYHTRTCEMEDGGSSQAKVMGKAHQVRMDLRKERAREIREKYPPAPNPFQQKADERKSGVPRKVSKGVRPKPESVQENDTPQTLNRVEPSVERSTPATLSPRESDTGDTMQETVIETMRSAKSGVRKITNANLKTKDASTKTTDSTNSPRSLKTVSAEIQPSDSQRPSTTPVLVESQSMNLLDDTGKHLFKLMRGLHSNLPEPETRSYDPERVNAACNCAKNIREIMKLKLDAMRLQGKLEGKL